jgi:hypothetical protein
MHSVDLEKLGFEFTSKPLLIGGKAMEYYGLAYFSRGARAFPSYLQAGPSFFEKSKRKMIAEDIATALRLIEQEIGD